MITQIQKLTRPNDTLDFLNVNNPYIIAEKNAKIIDKIANSILKEVEEYRIYTEKDTITVKSNGIQDRFFFRQSGSMLVLAGNMVLNSGRYTKETEDVNTITNSGVVNLEEIVEILPTEGFLPRIYSFDTLLNTTMIPYSNFMTVASVFNVLMQKNGTNTEIPIVDDLRTGDRLGLTESEIISYEESKGELIHKTDTLELVKIEKDIIDNVDSANTFIYGSVFEDSFIPSDPEECVDVKYMDNNAYKVEVNATQSITIPSDIRESLSPINKEILEVMTDKYISRTDNLAHNIIISDDREDIDNDNVISNKEAKTLIDIFFYGKRDAYIDSLAEFKKYMEALCNLDGDLLSSDLKIEGGKVYIGFDYNNMHSIFNSEAITRILFERKGEYDKATDGITFDSGRYFMDQAAINKLSSYAEYLGINIDIGKQRTAETYESIRKVVAKLCLMTPDTIIDGIVSPIPIIMPRTIVTIPPVVTSFYPPLLLKYPLLPRYYSVPKIFVLIPPQISYIYQSISILRLDHQPYFEFNTGLIIIPPFVGPGFDFVPVVKTPTMNSPATRQVACPETVSPNSDSLILFSDANNGCTNRHVAKSTRTINMIDAAGLLSGMETLHMYGMTDDSIVIDVPEMIAFALNNVLSCMGAYAKFPVNVDFCDLIHTIKEESEIVTSLCLGSSSSSSSSSSITLTPGKYLIFGGFIIDADGKKEGTAKVTGLEWFSIQSITFEKFRPFNDGPNLASFDVVANAMGTSIKRYVDKYRASTRTTNEKQDLIIVSFNDIVSGATADGDIFMEEYLDTTYPWKNFNKPGDLFIGTGGRLGLVASSLSGASSLPERLRPWRSIKFSVSEQPLDKAINVISRKMGSEIEIDVAPYIANRVLSGNFMDPLSQSIMIYNEDNMSVRVDLSDSHSFSLIAKTKLDDLENPFSYSELVFSDKDGVMSTVIFPAIVSVSAFSAGQSECTSMPEPIIRTAIGYPCFPAEIVMNGPFMVGSGATTEDYYVTSSYPVKETMIIETELQRIVPLGEATEGPIFIIEKGDSISNKETFEFFAEDLSQSNDERIDLSMVKIDVERWCPDAYRVTKKTVTTSIIKCVTNISYPQLVKLGDSADIIASVISMTGGDKTLNMTVTEVTDGDGNLSISPDSISLAESENSAVFTATSEIGEDNLQSIAFTIQAEGCVAVDGLMAFTKDDVPIIPPSGEMDCFIIASPPVLYLDPGESADVTIYARSNNGNEYTVESIDGSAIGGVDFTPISKVEDGELDSFVISIETIDTEVLGGPTSFSIDIDKLDCGDLTIPVIIGGVPSIPGGGFEFPITCMDRFSIPSMTRPSVTITGEIFPGETPEEAIEYFFTVEELTAIEDVDFALPTHGQVIATAGADGSVKYTFPIDILAPTDNSLMKNFIVRVATSNCLMVPQEIKVTIIYDPALVPGNGEIEFCQDRFTIPSATSPDTILMGQVSPGQISETELEYFFMVKEVTAMEGIDFTLPTAISVNGKTGRVIASRNGAGNITYGFPIEILPGSGLELMKTFVVTVTSLSCPMIPEDILVTIVYDPQLLPPRGGGNDFCRARFAIPSATPPDTTLIGQVIPGQETYEELQFIFEVTEGTATKDIDFSLPTALPNEPFRGRVLAIADDDGKFSYEFPIDIKPASDDMLMKDFIVVVFPLACPMLPTSIRVTIIYEPDLFPDDIEPGGEGDIGTPGIPGTPGNMEFDYERMLFNEDGYPNAVTEIVHVGETSECDGGMSKVSGLDPGDFESISNLTDLDSITQKQDPGQVAGALTIRTMYSASRLIVRNRPSTDIPYTYAMHDNTPAIGKPRVAMEKVSIQICMVFGAIDGAQDGDGDILAQGYPKEDIPTGGIPIKYISPTGSFVEHTAYERGDKYSVYIVDLNSYVDELETEDGEPFVLQGYEVVNADNMIQPENQIKKNKVLVSKPHLPGMMSHFKNVGSDPKFPVASGYGGFVGAANMGKTQISAGMGPLPQLVVLADDQSIYEYAVAKNLQKSFLLSVVKGKFHVYLPDTASPLSQNRMIQYTWA